MEGFGLKLAELCSDQGVQIKRFYANKLLSNLSGFESSVNTSTSDTGPLIHRPSGFYVALPSSPILVTEMQLEGAPSSLMHQF